MKSSFLSANALSLDLGLLLLRLFSGGAMLTHGIPKLMKVIASNFEFGDPIGIGPEATLILATFAESLCALLIILGLFMRLATIPLIINMAVAALIVHQTDAFGIKELAVLYLGIFISLFFTGPGRYAFDGRTSKRY